MTRRNLLQTVLLAVAMALATARLGWWTVPVVAAAWGLTAGARDRPALVATFAAGLGWMVLLIWTAAAGPVGVLAHKAAASFGVHPLVLYALTVLFPMALAWGAAVVGEAGRAAYRGRRGPTEQP